MNRITKLVTGGLAGAAVAGALLLGSGIARADTDTTTTTDPWDGSTTTNFGDGTSATTITDPWDGSTTTTWQGR